MKQVKGFLFRSFDAVPGPIITVVEENDVIFGVYPDGSNVVLKHDGRHASPSDLELREHFKACIEGPKATEFSQLTSFAVTAQDITIGSPQQILEKLERECENPEHSVYNREALTAARNNWRDLLACERR